MDIDLPSIDPEQLTKWQDSLPILEVSICDLDDQPINRSSHFCYNEKINRKIAFWVGNVWCLKANAIVCCNNETFTLKTDLITRNTLLCAGRDLTLELKNEIKFCPISEAVLTGGYSLPCSRIIHVVGPRYCEKYATAAESALHNAYRNVLTLARDNNLRTLALRCIHSSVWKYPSVAGAHIALRTVRRFLEKYGSDFDLVIFAVSNHNREAYEALLPLYFPRSRVEERQAVEKLPANVGDENGQLFIPERKIRISAIPYYHITHSSSDDEEDCGADRDDVFEKVNATGRGYEDGAVTIVSEKGEEITVSNEIETNHLHMSDRAFLEMKESVDKERIRRVVKGNPPNNVSIRTQFYKRLFIRAQKEDFGELVKKKFLYHCGYDRQNRPVMVFIAHRWFLKAQELDWMISKSLPNLSRVNNGNSKPFGRYSKAENFDTFVTSNEEVNEKYRLFFINQMEPLVKQKYVFLYIQSLCDKEGSLPSTKCLQSLLGMLDARYIANLDALYILHSTLVNKIRCWFRLPSVLYDRTIFLKGVEHLYDIISPDEVELPEFVLAHDLDRYGVRYYEGRSAGAAGPR